MRRIRAAVSVGLAVLYPGLGHAYLREWVRALMWFGLGITAVALFVPEGAVVTSGSAWEMVQGTARNVPTTATAVLSVVVVFNAVDAYVLAKRRSLQAKGPRCPHCGGELEPDIDFCHWCTTRLEEPE